MTIIDDWYARGTAWLSLRGTLPIDPRGFQGPPPPVEPGLALLVSPVELEMWQDRRTSGPFRTAGDFSSNSPGHWSEMNTAMGLAPFQSARWQGPTNLTNGRVNTGGTTNDPPGSIRRMAHDMMSAAYAAITVGNTSIAQAIVAEIEYQATRTTLNYGSRTLWPFDYYDDINPLFMHAVWVKDYVLAYSVCKSMGATSSVVEQWFLNLAELCEQIVHANMRAVFPNRKSDSYTSRSSFVNTEITAHARLSNGSIIYHPRIMRFYNNRRNNQAGYCGLVGALLNNTYYINEYKRYAREWLMFGHRITPDGTGGDPHRGTDTYPQLGFSYTLHSLETMVQAMDALARAGDTSVYEFSSSDGSTHSSWGTAHAKTMEQVLETYIRWITNHYPAQYTGTGAPPGTYVAGDPKYRIQSRALNGSNVREMINDGHLLLAANYFRRPDWQSAVLRQGTPTGFTSTPQGVGSINGWAADWRQRFLRSLDANPYGG